MTYEYKCSACNHEWECEQKITEEPVKKCPKCKKVKAKRLISKNYAGFRLLGGGWSPTGYSD